MLPLSGDGSTLDRPLGDRAFFRFGAVHDDRLRRHITPNLHFANISGVVTDAVSRAPIANATVTFHQSGAPALTAKTDNEGRYSAAALSVGDVRIDASAVGYQTYSVTFTLSEGSNALNIQLHPN